MNAKVGTFTDYKVADISLANYGRSEIHIAETEMLFGFVQDLEEKGTYSGFIEASSRLTSNWSWKLNGYFFSSDDIEDPYYFLRRDDHVQFSLEYYF